MVIVVTSDNQRFNVTCPAIIESKSISCQLKNSKEGVTASAFLPNISGRAFQKLVDYCQTCEPEISAAYKEIAFGVEGPRSMTEWEKRFIPSDTEHLLEIINAAEALELTELLNFSCMALAEWMKDKSVQEVRDQLNFEYDFKAVDEPVRTREKLWISKQ